MSHVDLKVVLLGMEYCGKTSLIERFLKDRFIGENKYQNTIGAAYGAKRIALEGKRTLTMGLWDTAGSERYESMSRIYYRGARAAVVCYDASNPKTWDKLQHWVTEVKQNEETCRIYICGTKTDLLNGNNRNRKVDYHNVLDYAEALSEKDQPAVKVYDTSAKTGENVATLFTDIAKDYLEDPRNTLTEFNKTLKLDSDSLDGKEATKCCVIL